MDENTRPKLQVAIDVTDTTVVLELVERIHPFFDIVEIGTPLIIEDGLRPLEAVKARFPDKECLADTKITDAGYIEATSAFKRGADIITVLGVSDDATVQGAVKASADYGGQVMVDLIHVVDPIERGIRLEAMGVDILCLHTAYDRQGSGVDPMADLQQMRCVVKCPLAIAGGIKLENVERAVSLGADIVIVGGAITTQPDPGEAAHKIMDALTAAGS